MDFYKRMALVCEKIPEGTVATYGQVALLCGKPKNARQVGYGLKHNLAGQVPAHRVINSKGILSGAVYFDTSDMQKLLLEKEDVEVIWTPEGYQVDIKRFGWKNTLEDARRLREIFEAEGI
ncbi:MAG: MGMT family protein [Lachnospiraceae bacterium]|nr:MGMT family protein [Lachnospiraceae bacterium]